MRLVRRIHPQFDHQTAQAFASAVDCADKRQRHEFRTSVTHGIISFLFGLLMTCAPSAQGKSEDRQSLADAGHVIQKIGTDFIAPPRANTLGGYPDHGQSARSNRRSPDSGPRGPKRAFLFGYHTLPWPSSDVHLLAKLKCPPGLLSVDPQIPIQTSSRDGLTLAER